MFGPLVNQKWSYFWDQNISTLISTQLLSKVSVIKRPSWEHINIKIQRQQEPNSELCVLVGQRAAVLIVWRTNTKTDCWWWRCLRTNFHRSAHSVCCWDVCPHSIKSLKMFKELNCFSCSGSYWFQFRFPFSASSSLSINKVAEKRFWWQTGNRSITGCVDCTGRKDFPFATVLPALSLEKNTHPHKAHVFL